MHLPQARKALEAECNTMAGALLVHFLRIGFYDCAEFHGLEAQLSQARQREVILHQIVHTAEHRPHICQNLRDLRGVVRCWLLQLLFEYVNKDEEGSQRITDLVRQGTGETPQHCQMFVKFRDVQRLRHSASLLSRSLRPPMELSAGNSAYGERQGRAR